MDVFYYALTCFILQHNHYSYFKVIISTLLLKHGIRITTKVSLGLQVPSKTLNKTIFQMIDIIQSLLYLHLVSYQLIKKDVRYTMFL